MNFESKRERGKLTTKRRGHNVQNRRVRSDMYVSSVQTPPEARFTPKQSSVCFRSLSVTPFDIVKPTDFTRTFIALTTSYLNEFTRSRLSRSYVSTHFVCKKIVSVEYEKCIWISKTKKTNVPVFASYEPLVS